MKHSRYPIEFKQSFFSYNFNSSFSSSSLPLFYSFSLEESSKQIHLDKNVNSKCIHFNFIIVVIIIIIIIIVFVVFYRTGFLTPRCFRFVTTWASSKSWRLSIKWIIIIVEFVFISIACFQIYSSDGELDGSRLIIFTRSFLISCCFVLFYILLFCILLLLLF